PLFLVRPSKFHAAFVVLALVHFPAKFRVIGPRAPVTAILGQETVLPCHLSPRMSAANMEVRWFRSDFVSFVHLYRDGTDQYEGQMPEYRERTELLKAGLTDGNVPLRILNIRLSDEGEYHCFVQDDTFYEETILELLVAGQWHVSVLALCGLQALFYPITTTTVTSCLGLQLRGKGLLDTYDLSVALQSFLGCVGMVGLTDFYGLLMGSLLVVT
uniref:Ig-like domain-containing protein n=1 Tax=Terrapene triunguis TaxID=2587831 RepID=A0A674JP41_9SAUR